MFQTHVCPACLDFQPLFSTFLPANIASAGMKSKSLLSFQRNSL
jgi:hypothetical protein